MKSHSSGSSGSPYSRHPARAGEQLVVALHVEQRHLADDRAEEVGYAREHVAHQQAAVAAALDAEVLRRGDLALDQVLGDGGEVFVGPVPVLLERGLVPLRAELAAAADVGDHVDAALLQPGRADDGRCSPAVSEISKPP